MADGYPAKGIENHQSTVFDTFVCGGGSSFGYKLAGYHHLGGVELDEKTAETYKTNHHPEHFYNMDMRDFVKMDNLPEELYHLDLLGGSPPCSTFSISGGREKDWGKEKRFDEGQKLQTLDDLVFVWCDAVIKLRPKCFIMENVTGLIKGNAKSYAKRIVEKLYWKGCYDVQVFCMNSALMGVPQARERVFFIGHKHCYDLPKLVLDFNEPPILFKEIMESGVTDSDLSDYQMEMWRERKRSDTTFGDIALRLWNKNTMFNNYIVHSDRVLPTLTAGSPANALYDIPRNFTERELLLGSTFPTDYKYPSKNRLYFLVGMCVPPIMMAQISYEIWRQWLKPIKEHYGE